MTTFESVSTDHSTAQSDSAYFSSTANVDSQFEANPFITHDLAGKLKVSFDKFLAAFSGQSPEHALVPDPEVSSIAQDSEIGRLRDLYCNSARGSKRTNAEKLRYGPFVNLANAVLKALNNGEDPPIVFVRNDPHHLMGEAGIQRVPDVVVVNSKLESVKDGKWREYSNQNSKTSYNTRWTWNQIHFTLEFKLSVPVIELTGSGVQSNPPETSQQQPPILPTHSFSNDDYVALDSTLSLSAPAEKRFVAPHTSQPAGSTFAGGPSSFVRSQRNDKISIEVCAHQSNQPPKDKGTNSQDCTTYSSASGVKSTSLSAGNKRALSSEMGFEEQKPKKLRGETALDFEPVDIELCGPGIRIMGYPLPASEHASIKSERSECIPDDVPDDLLRQTTLYAIDQLAYCPSLRHVFNMQVVDGRLWIAYYDRSGVILTEKCISFVDDLDSFVLLLKAMLNMKKGDRGLLEQVQLSRGIVPSPEGTPADSSANLELIWSLAVPGHTIVLRKSLARVRYYGLLGKASAVDSCFMICKEDCVEKERCGGKKNKLYAIKRSWPAKAWESEVDIIEKGRKALEVLDADAGFRETHAIKGNLVDRLPTVHFSADLDDLEGRGFRAKLGVFLGDLENRVWRVIVFDILVPIHDLEDVGEFKQCIQDIFQALHFLSTIAKIMHCDVSSGNCMFRRLADGSVVGVLNDWDLSKSRDSTGQSSKGPTGTRPFMAIDLLVPNPPAHLERHDWESLIYVIIWIACRFESGGHETNREALKGWLDPSLEEVKKDKLVFLFFRGLPDITNHYQPLRSWILQLLAVFRTAHYAARYGRHERPMPEMLEVDKHSAEPFDEETLGGRVTYEALWAILSK
ncbi:hypothetical protein DFH11DRAFT_1878096 [Phellopilus nigrolimitatus]|nr:hypothetical protein DFH11DRAFT_1878096 [Phellopilus nigrolimitatus]